MGKINVNSCASVIDEDGIMWLSDCHFNGLFKFNILTKQLEFVGYFDNWPTSLYLLQRNAYVYGNEVIFTPCYDKTIKIYNKKENEFMSIEIPVQENVTYFLNSVKVRDSIYIMAEDFVVWEYNLKNKAVLENKEMTTICKNFASNIEKPIIAECYDGKMLLFERGGKRGCQIDLRTLEVTYLTAEIEQNLDILFYDGEQYWFFLCDSLDVVWWDGKQSYKVYESENNEWITNKKISPYMKLEKINGQVYILNYYAKYIMKVNEEKQTLEPAFSYPFDFKVLSYNGCGGTFSDMHIYEDTIIFVPGRGNMMLFYDMEKQMVEGIKLELAKKEIPQFEKVLQCKLKDGMSGEEEGFVELDDLISECGIGNCQNEKKNFGQMIWSEFKNYNE